MTFEEVATYLQGLVGHRVEVSVWSNVGTALDVSLAGVVARVVGMPVGRSSAPRGVRYFCQVGDEEQNGFAVTSLAFERAGLDLVYPEPAEYALFVVMEGGYSVVIRDERIYWEGGGPRLPD